MIKTLLLAIVLNASELAYSDLEKFYWDCDTLFMKGELGGQDTWSCLAVTEEFQKHFSNREDFMLYWHEHKMKEWTDRGYYPSPDFV